MNFDDLVTLTDVLAERGVRKLPGRDVDGDRRCPGPEAGLPLGELPARGAQHGAPELDDEPVLLRDRYEVTGRYEPALGVAPALPGAACRVCPLPGAARASRPRP